MRLGAIAVRARRIAVGLCQLDAVGQEILLGKAGAVIPVVILVCAVQHDKDYIGVIEADLVLIATDLLTQILVFRCQCVVFSLQRIQILLGLIQFCL